MPSPYEMFKTDHVPLKKIEYSDIFLNLFRWKRLKIFFKTTDNFYGAPYINTDFL